VFRLLGFTVGSAIAITAIVVFVGMPEFHLGDESGSAERYEEAIRKLKEKRHAPDANVPDEVPGPDPSAQVHVADAIDTAGNQTSPRDAEPDEPEAAVAEAAELVTDSAAAVDEPSWQAIWNPFRSKVAAEGFVQQLEKVTGLDYRVVKVKSGVYQAAFAYRDDEERIAKLETIALATGLQLGDGNR